MPRLIQGPTVVNAAGNKPKRIEEFAGQVNSGHSGVSVARMVSPQGWQEPGQRPDFEEITVVLRGMLRVEHDGGSLDVRAGQAIVTLARRVGPLQHARTRRRRIHRRLHARFHAVHRAPGLLRRCHHEIWSSGHRIIESIL